MEQPNPAVRTMKAEPYALMEAAEETHWWYLGLQDLVLGNVRRENQRLHRPLKILDAGCGTGRFAERLAAFGQVSACDNNPQAVERTLRRGISEVFLADLCADEGIPTSERFDVITCLDVISHCGIREEEKALRNLHDALRAGGLLIVHAPAFEILRGPHDQRVQTRHRSTRNELLQRLSAAGFRDCDASYRLLPMFLPMLAWRKWGAVLRDGKPERSDLDWGFPKWLNSVLTALVQWENRIVAAGLHLPFGTSIYSLARK
jgi:SAM-dependent methyltransferase